MNPCFRYLLLFVFLVTWSQIAFAHGVDERTSVFLENAEGMKFIPFMYIGAKHMVTGYDHLLFLFGVIFFLTRPKDIIIYVSIFTVGHSLTLLLAVMLEIKANAAFVDAVIGFSVLYKGFDNLGGWKKLFGTQPNLKFMVFVFGLIHGFGLATKLQDYTLDPSSILPNLIAFNIGVEVGQIFSLLFLLLIIQWIKVARVQYVFSSFCQGLLIAAGCLLMAYHLTDYAI